MTGPKKPNITSSFLYFTTALTTCSILIFGGVWFVNEQHLFKKESEQMQRQFRSAQEGELKQRVEIMLSLITDLQAQLEESVRTNVQQRTHEAWSIADNLCRINKERKSPSELAELVREALRPIRYNNGRGYFFATSLDGVEQLFADRPELEGKNLLDMRDANGKMVIQDMIRIARDHQEGFYEYVWTKPGVTEESHRKISYIKYHPTLDWFIGTGEYIDDAEVDLKAEVIRRIEYERFDNGGYIFSGTLDGVSLAGPAKGRNMLDVFDNNGVKIVQELIRVAKNGGGFIEYSLPSFPNHASHRKLSYAIQVSNWDWYVGAGTNMDRIDTEIALLRERLWSDAQKTLLLLLSLLILIILMQYLLATRVTRHLRTGLTAFKDFFQQAGDRRINLIPAKQPYAELEDMARSANAMLESMLAAENKLKVSEERFRGIFQNVSTVAVQGYTMDGTVSYWNRASETFYGYTAEEALGRNLLDLIIPPAMHGTMQSAIQRMVETGKALPAEELALMRKDGSPISVYSSQVLVQIPGHNAEVFCIDVNLTERKRAEEKFRNIVNASPMGIHIYQLEDDGRLIFTGNNRAADRLLGADNSAFIGLTIEEAFPALRDTEVPERYRRAARDGGNWRTEHIDYHDGMISGAFEVYAFQVSQGMTAVLFNEITKRKRTEEELKGRENRARRQRSAITTLVLDASIMNAGLPAAMPQIVKITALSVEVAKAGIWMLSEDGIELRCLSMYESGPDRHSQDMVLRASEFPRYFQALLDESRISAHDAQNDPRTSEMTNGYLAPLGITSMLDAGIQSEGRLVGVLCLEHIGSPRLWKADEEAFASTMAAIVAQIMANDRRRKAEWAQVESEELQRSLLQTIPDLILRTDIKGNIIFVNEINFAGIDFIDRESYYGKSIFSFIPEQDRPKVMENARKRLEEDIGPQEYKLQFEDGTQIDAEINGAVVRDRDGKATGMVYVVRNISDRKGAEKDKADLQSQLVQAQKMEAVGRLAGGVAHDFNNMLGAILGYTELALNKAGLSDPLSKYLQQIHKAAERSADLTRQLLTFARKQTVTPKVLDLNETVEGMLTLLRRIIGEDINLVWRPGSDLWPVKMDHSQFDQILTNLCVNARDAITGVGRLTIETDRQTFDEAYCRDHAGVIPGDFSLLAVSDNGCGMDKKTMDNLFEPFFTTKEQGKGTGLGLASVYGAVKQNNGFINVFSEPGLGTTFNIYLPRHVDNGVQTTEERLLQSAERGSETILLVEDEPMILELTTTMLEQLGYTVLAAPLPGEAIRLAGEHTGHIDLLMTDVIMPEMNGHDLAQNLLSLYPGMKRLFMSGYTADVIAHHGVLDEGVHFIQKPFTLNDLSARIREVLDFRNDK